MRVIPRRGVLLLPAAAGLGLALSSAAQEPPSFPTRAELVTVDAVVVDSEGRPVPGLGREAFRVLDEGKPREIVAFERVTRPEAPADARQLAPASSHVAANFSGAASGRFFGLVYDDLHLAPIDVDDVRKALRVFVERETLPGDRVLLARTSDGRYWTTRLGPKDAGFLAAISALGGRERLLAEPAAFRMSAVEAEAIAVRGDELVAARVRRRRAVLSGLCTWNGTRCQCLVPGAPGSGSRSGEDGCLEPPGAPTANEVHARERQAQARALRVLLSAIGAASGVRGRKSFVLVSRGFAVDSSLDVRLEVLEAAARANVAVYFVDAGGLTTGASLFSAEASRGALPAQDIGATLADLRRAADGARAVAESTGGLSLQQNDAAEALARVGREASVVYLLGFEPSGGRPGRRRSLKVEVRGAGLTVRARSAYVVPATDRPRAEAGDPLERALTAPFDEGAVPLRLATYVMGRGADSPRRTAQAEVLVAGEIDAEDLLAVLPATVTLRARVLTRAPNGETHSSSSDLQLALRPSDAPRAAGVPILLRLALGRGLHRVRLGVEVAGRVGTATRDLLVPDPGGLRLTSPVLSDREDLSGRPVPLARDAFPRSATLLAYVELHGTGPVAESGTSSARIAWAAVSEDGREWLSLAEQPMRGEDGRLSALLRIPLSDAPPGASELRVRATDLSSGEVLVERQRFLVTGP